MNNGINLLTTRQTSIFTPLFDRIHLLRYLAIFLLFGVSVISMILFLLITLSPLPALKQKESTSLNALSKYHPDIAKTIILNERMSSITTLMSKRVATNSVIDSVQSKMPAGMSFVNLSIAHKTVQVTSESNSLSLIDTFVNKLVEDSGANKKFVKVTMNSIQYDDQRNRFILQVELTLL